MKRAQLSHQHKHYGGASCYFYLQVRSLCRSSATVCKQWLMLPTDWMDVLPQPPQMWLWYWFSSFLDFLDFSSLWEIGAGFLKSDVLERFCSRNQTPMNQTYTVLVQVVRKALEGEAGNPSGLLLASSPRSACSPHILLLPCCRNGFFLESIKSFFVFFVILVLQFWVYHLLKNVSLKFQSYYYC